MSDSEAVPLDVTQPQPLQTLDLDHLRSLVVRNLGIPADSADISKWYLNIDDYEVTEILLGSGTYGHVYKAIHRITQEAVAVKKVRRGDELTYQREVLNLASVNHPTILPLIGCTRFSSEVDPPGMIVTPLMETGSLDAVLEKVRARRLPDWWNPTAKLKILQGTATGLKVLRDHRLLCRNLAPQTILLDRNYEPKLYDFGPSEYLPAGTDIHYSADPRNPKYAAPEVICGEPYEFPADIFAFGMLMYSVWTGQNPISVPPRKTLTLMLAVKSILSGSRPLFPPGAPELLTTLAEKCWHPDPGQRPEIGKVVEELHNPALLASVRDMPHGDSCECRDAFLLFGRPASIPHEPQSGQGEWHARLAQKRRECDAAKAELLERTRERDVEQITLLAKTREYEAAKARLLERTRAYEAANARWVEAAHECERLKARIERARDPARQLVRGQWAFGGTDLRGVENWDWVEANGVEAVEAFEQSANRGNPDDENNYGLCLLHGIGTARSEAAAVRYFRLSAGHGNAFGQYNLGWCFMEGIGVAQNDQKAAGYFKLSADQGYSEAEVRYGICLQRGIGIDKNQRLAVRYFESSADQGNSNAEWRLGLCLYRGDGIAKDSGLAFTFFERSANQGHAEGERLLGQCLQKGFGIRRDAMRGAEFLKRSAVHGNSESRWRYGLCLRNGVGVDQNAEEAFAFFREAASAGNSDGQYWYGLCFRDGIGTTADGERAKAELQRAMSQGHQSAREAYNELVEREGEADLARRGPVIPRQASSDRGDPAEPAGLPRPESSDPNVQGAKRSARQRSPAPGDNCSVSTSATKRPAAPTAPGRHPNR
jgi:TPR repeat protein